MRPLSGSTTLALLTDMVHRFGPDNIVSLTAATILTETTLLHRGGLHWNCGNKTNAACAACDPGGFPGRSHGRDCFRNTLPGGAIMPGRDRPSVRQRVDPQQTLTARPRRRALPNRQSIIVQIFPSPADNLIFYREIFRK